MGRLTKRGIDAAMFDPDGPKWQWISDDDPPGFGLRLYPTGRKAFALRYRNESGRQRYLTLGPFPTLSVHEARSRARRHLAGILEGGDPSENRRQARTRVLTVAELMAAWLADYARHHRRRWSEDERRVQSRVVPHLGSLSLDELTPARLSDFHRCIGADAPVEANRCVETIRAAWRWAEGEGRLPDGLTDPSRRLKRYREKSRDRWLRRHELARLMDAVDREDDPFVRAAVRLLLLTGLRKGELLGARWADIELERGEIRLRRTKSGSPQTRALPTAAVRILRSLPRMNSEWVFPSPTDPGKRRKDLKRQWGRVRAAADLEDVTLHDLRRTAGSYMAQAGVPLQVIQNVLGHTHPSVTKLYARLSSQNEREALEMVADSLPDLFPADRATRAPRTVQTRSTARPTRRPQATHTPAHTSSPEPLEMAE